MPTVEDVMAANVVSVDPDDTVEEVITWMLVRNVTELPVVNMAGEIVGVIAESHLLDFVHHPEMATEPIYNYMNRDICALGVDSDWAQSEKLLSEPSVQRLPVLRGDRVAGVISRRDLLRYALHRYNCSVEAKGPVAPKRRTSKGPVKLLLADDDPIVVRVLSTVLERSFKDQLELTAFNDPHLAKKHLSEAPVDILITDIEMPGINGLELLCYAKRQSPWTDVLVITAHSTASALLEALEMGASDYLIKPIDRVEILEVITHAQKRQERWRKALADSEED